MFKAHHRRGTVRALPILLGFGLLSACVPFPTESLDPPASVAPSTVTDNDDDEPVADAATTTAVVAESANPGSAASTPTTDAAPTTTTATPTTAAASVAAIEWGPCPASNLECGALAVPVEYSDPSLGTIDIAVAIHRARKPDERIGVLLINPGGPGASGVEFVEWSTGGDFGIFSRPILDRFDIIGWDPRGVGASEPEFACGTDEQWIASEKAIDDYIDTPAEEETARAAVRTCEATMGPAAMRLGSEYVARDMDQIRASLGEEQISYFGASYGSAIGVWYATLFPGRVRAMVVDGADNPVDDLSTDQAIIESVREEWQTLETKLREALEACDSPNCPIYNDGDPVGFYLDHIDDLRLVDEQFGGNPSAGFLAVITPLYSESQWPLLWAGLAAVAQGNPGPLSQLAERQLMGEEGASDTAHINCLDAWALGQQFGPDEQLRVDRVVDDALKDELPLLWALPYGQSFCPEFEGEVLPPFDRPFDGGGVPIVVIGNVSDPVTPFTESEELVDTQLSNGYLVVADAPAHVVYPDDRCVVGIVDDVLVDLKLPAERRTQCSG